MQIFPSAKIESIDTVELIMTEHLDRIEALVASNAQGIADNRQAIADLRHTVGDLSNTVGDLRHTVGGLSNTVGDLSNTVGDLSNTVGDLSNTVKVLTEHQAHYAEQLRGEVTNLTQLINVLATQHGETIERIDIMQSEIRGLQVENRRIMERWSNGNN
jgi:ABC-type transporter Mla subunit MlaD